jgi:hypothetical protein
VTSFDTTSPFLRSFKDAKHNYFTSDGAFTAVRVPQVQGNARVERLIRAGTVDQWEARQREQESLQAIRRLDRGEISPNAALQSVLRYERLIDASSNRDDRRAAYLRTLESQPWKDCPCEICRAIGVEVIIFRGSERNKRRGFHNLSVLYGRLHKELSTMAAARKGRRRAPAAL